MEFFGYLAILFKGWIKLDFGVQMQSLHGIKLKKVPSPAFKSSIFKHDIKVYQKIAFSRITPRSCYHGAATTRDTMYIKP